MMLRRSLFLLNKGLTRRAVPIKAPIAHRCLSSTRLLLKKGKSKEAAPKTPQPTLDLDKLRGQCQVVLDKHSRELSEIKVGRDNVEAVADLRVPKTKLPVSKYADVFQKDPRTYVVTVFDPDDVKLVVSTIAQSGLGFNPQPTPKNPQQLTIAIPPPTETFKEEQAKKIAKKLEVTKMMLRAIRNDWMKRVQKLSSKDEIKDGERDVSAIIEVFAKDAEKEILKAKP
ncbi:ribosome recycling factor domain-containing protein [Protomyces lactucae-debilis]|uniref:Ribosome recycling factor domain-containing protein n=1 Tax=Protomyces lactucae-debilis TaxID=2754530 RepID=A0A1Y2F926_PROLT|nr:ribosome recycling factor domain-containing protein [Protomyces lactucae-debilis]ORY80401.1 ribosome recycling factor domain-containing protein [Protomyces lactucae-debilis]